jgi:hypothetical protein
MKTQPFLIAMSLTLLLLASAVLTAHAAPGQALVTPTPGPDGQIIWIVDEGQNCSQIATAAGITLDQLRGLNGLDANCALFPGQKLIIGTGGPSGPQPSATGPVLTPTPAAATPTPIPGSIDVCVLLFDDQNGNTLHEDAEPGIEGGAISISGSSGQYSGTRPSTAASDPICFEKVPVGTYTISVAAPAGYNATTLLNYTLEVTPRDVKVNPTIQPGDRVYVNFGAQKSSQAPVQGNTTSSGGDDNTLVGIIGGVLLLLAGGIAFYAWRAGRKPKYMS